MMKKEFKVEAKPLNKNVTGAIRYNKENVNPKIEKNLDQIFKRNKGAFDELAKK